MGFQKTKEQEDSRQRAGRSEGKDTATWGGGGRGVGEQGQPLSVCRPAGEVVLGDPSGPAHHPLLSLCRYYFWLPGTTFFKFLGIWLPGLSFFPLTLLSSLAGVAF